MVKQIKKKKSCSDITVPTDFIYSEIKKTKQMLKWKPMNSSLITLLKHIQIQNAMQIFKHSRKHVGEVSQLIKISIRSVLKQCQETPVPGTKVNIESLQRDNMLADETIEALKTKIESLDYQILREKSRLKILKDKIDVDDD